MGLLFETKDLTKSFGGVVAIANLDFHIDQGEIVGLIGPNGSGKTTFFNVVTGVLKPNRGKVRFKGEDITALKPHDIAKRGIVRTFQLNLLFGTSSVLDNVTTSHYLHRRTGVLDSFLNTSAARREEQALLQMGREILDFAGMSDRQGQLGQELSYGWQKTLTLAIGLSAGPALLLLDEPLTGISPDRVEAITGLIRRAKQQGVTTCLIEHNVRSIMDLCDRIVALNFGEKIAEGLPHEVVHNKDVIKAYLGRWGNA